MQMVQILDHLIARATRWVLAQSVVKALSFFAEFDWFFLSIDEVVLALIDKVVEELTSGGRFILVFCGFSSF